MLKSTRRRFTFFLFVPYSIIFILPIFLLYYTFNQGVNQMQDNVENNSYITTNNFVENINIALEDIKIESLNLSLQMACFQNRNISFVRENYSLMTQLQHQMAYKTISNPLVDTIYIIFFEDNMVISPFVAGNNLDNFYGNFFMYNDTELDEFKLIFTSKNYNREILPDSKVYRSGNICNRPVLVQSFPNNPSKTPLGIILFILNSEYIDNVLNNSIPNNQSTAILYIKDIEKDDPVIFSNKNADYINEVKINEIMSEYSRSGIGTHYMNMDGEKTLVSFAKSNNDSVIGGFAQPLDIAMGNINRFKLIIAVQGLGVAFISWLIASYFTSRNMDSVNSVIDFSLKMGFKEHYKFNFFNYIKNTTSNLIKHNDKLTNHVEKQRLILIESFIQKLLLGRFLFKSDIIREQESLMFSMPHNNFVVLFLVIEGQGTDYSNETVLKQIRKHKLSVKEIFLDEFGDTVYFADWDTMSLTAVICVDDIDILDMDENLKSFLNILVKNAPLRVYIGRTVYEIMDIPRAFGEARHAFQNTSPSYESKIIWYKDTLSDYQLNTYSLSIEQSIMNHIMVGNTYEVDRILSELYENNITNNNRLANTVQYFAYDIYRLAVSILNIRKSEETDTMLNKLNIKFNAVTVVANIESFDAFFSEVENISVYMSSLNKEEVKSSSDVLCGKIIDHIQTDFTETNLCISSIAEKFKISDKYLSQLFKERTGENISDYIERLRINKACLLLKESNNSVKKISLEVGYFTPHTFRSAFKRRMSVTPVQYRNLNSSF